MGLYSVTCILKLVLGSPPHLSPSYSHFCFFHLDAFAGSRYYGRVYRTKKNYMARTQDDRRKGRVDDEEPKVSEEALDEVLEEKEDEDGDAEELLGEQDDRWE